ncbi:MAG: hypothetical protein LIO99_12880 [Clostridiales bacterium]|nr:hypothetical protein [Clostridiales bacterium]
MRRSAAIFLLGLLFGISMFAGMPAEGSRALAAGDSTETEEDASAGAADVTEEDVSAGSADTTGETMSAEEELAAGYTIGVSVYDPDDWEAIAFRDYFENYLGTAFNTTFYYNAERIDTAEDEIAFVEELHEAGVKGIISFLSTYIEDVLPVCEEYGMYYVLGSGTISDEVYENVKDNPYFLGTIGPTSEDEQTAGETLAENLAALDESGSASYLVVTGGSSIGNEMHRLRTIGILTKLQEIYGLTYDQSIEELAAITETTEIETGTDVGITIFPGYLVDGSEVGEAVTGGEYTMVISAMTIANAITNICNAEAEYDYDIRVGMVDCFTDQNYAFFNETDANGDSRLNCLVGKYGAIVGPSFVAMCNAYAGYADDFRDEDGCAFRLYQTYWYAADTEEFNELYAQSISTYENTYSATDMMQVLKLYNADADYAAFQEFAEK